LFPVLARHRWPLIGLDGFRSFVTGLTNGFSCFGEVTGIEVRMNRQKTATQTKSQFVSLLNVVAGGDETWITKHGRTAAWLVPAVGPAALQGRFVGFAVSTTIARWARETAFSG
jgi:antitoxin (DNA-binding transcriptional repressor) of toxin-antitoxin stability system